jgi:hypothetical protein
MKPCNKPDPLQKLLKRKNIYGFLWPIGRYQDYKTKKGRLRIAHPVVE